MNIEIIELQKMGKVIFKIMIGYFAFKEISFFKFILIEHFF